MQIVNTFNNRKIATAILLLVIFVLILLKEDIRRLVFNTVKMIFDLKILTPMLLMAVYTIGIVYILSQINIWDTSLVKDTIYWLFFTGIVLMSNFITSREAQNLFRKTLIESLKIVMIIEFIVLIHTRFHY